MTLAEQLDYAHTRPNLFQRAMRRFSKSTVGAWLFARTLRYCDALLLRFAHGRTAPELLAGLPTVFVTTTGARSGEKRTSPLVAIPIDEGLALVGTNFGQKATPAWYYNLRKHPDAEVRYHDRSVAVTAREVEAGELRDRIMRRARRIYAGYAAYEARITDRPIHVMRLDAATPGQSSESS